MQRCHGSNPLLTLPQYAPVLCEGCKGERALVLHAQRLWARPQQPLLQEGAQGDGASGPLGRRPLDRCCCGSRLGWRLARLQQEGGVWWDMAAVGDKSRHPTSAHAACFCTCGSGVLGVGGMKRLSLQPRSAHLCPCWVLAQTRSQDDTSCNEQVHPIAQSQSRTCVEDPSSCIDEGWGHAAVASTQIRYVWFIQMVAPGHHLHWCRCCCGWWPLQGLQAPSMLPLPSASVPQHLCLCHHRPAFCRQMPGLALTQLGHLWTLLAVHPRLHRQAVPLLGQLGWLRPPPGLSWCATQWWPANYAVACRSPAEGVPEQLRDCEHRLAGAEPGQQQEPPGACRSMCTSFEHAEHLQSR